MLNPNDFIRDSEKGVSKEQEKEISLFSVFMSKENKDGIICLASFACLNVFILVLVYKKVLDTFYFSSILRPTFILAGYLLVLLAFNLALSYISINILNKIYDNIPKEDADKKKHNKSDAYQSFKLLVDLFWTVSYVIWVGLYLVLVKNSILIAIMLGGTYFLYRACRNYIYRWSSLLYRTFHPTREIQIDYDNLFK